MSDGKSVQVCPIKLVIIASMDFGLIMGILCLD